MGVKMEWRLEGDRERGLGRHASWIQFNLGKWLNPLNLSVLISKVGAVTFHGHNY